MSTCDKRRQNATRAGDSNITPKSPKCITGGFNVRCVLAEAGIAAVLAKPFSPRQVLEEVKGLIDQEADVQTVDAG